ncbi:MAG: O-antigen ligase family protein [Candidatus Sulfotelmatobacter sp.]
MPPTIAVGVWLISLILLLCYDPARDPKTSAALWVPLIWFSFVGSRNPSQWLSSGIIIVQAQNMQEGNPIDRIIFSALIALSIAILTTRSFPWARVLKQNVALVVLVAFELVSATWSDFPLISAKRWIRDLDNYLVVLVILSDPRPLQAVRTVLRRLTYLLVPLSILLIKYFPVMGKQYERFSGAASFVGAGTSKNMLGAICLVSGIFFFWDTLTRWPERKQRRTKRILLVNVVFLVMTMWLMRLAASTTSDVCLVLGCAVVAAAHTKIFRRRPRLLKALAPVAFGLYLLLFFGLGMQGQLASAVGKDPTLTDRTKIWAFVLSMHTNPLIGTGYQTFWLGPRLVWFWTMAHLGALNEAHNGYLELYLELGLIGDALVIVFLISSYRQICRRLSSHFALTVFGMAAWIMIVFYNMSEAAFEGGLLFIMLLLGTIVVPVRLKGKMRRAADEPRPVAVLEGAPVSEHVLDFSS